MRHVPVEHVPDGAVVGPTYHHELRVRALGCFAQAGACGQGRYDLRLDVTAKLAVDRVEDPVHVAAQAVLMTEVGGCVGHLVVDHVDDEEPGVLGVGDAPGVRHGVESACRSVVACDDSRWAFHLATVSRPGAGVIRRFPQGRAVDYGSVPPINPDDAGECRATIIP